MNVDYVPDLENNLPNLKYKKTIPNRFPPKPHTTISRTNNIKNFQPTNNKITSTSPKSFPSNIQY